MRLLKVIYGPVASWRLGRSLGVDLICKPEKICSFNCIYCQLEKTKPTTTKKDIFVPTNTIKKELKNALEKTMPDVITLSGMGEPTLAKNINEAVQAVRKLTNLPIAILTNSTMMYDKKVQEGLHKLDIIVAKLDAPNPEIFQKINQPASKITLEKTIMGIKQMKEDFKGKFALQIMFIKENKDYAEEIAEIARDIQPDEIQINTPLRRSKAKALSMKELDRIERKFAGLKAISVYHSLKPKTTPLDMSELIKRRRTEP